MQQLAPKLDKNGKMLVNRSHNAFDDTSGKAATQMAILLRSGGKIADETFHNELVRATMSLEMNPKQGSYEAPVYEREMQLHIITHMCRDLPGFKNWVESMAKNNALRIGKTSDHVFQRYRYVLGSMFHHWSNIFGVYRACGYLEKVPLWFVNHNCHRIHPQDGSSPIQLLEYGEARARTGRVEIPAPDITIRSTVATLTRQHQTPNGKEDVSNFHKEFHGELSRAVLGTTLSWPTLDQWLEISDGLCYARSPVPEINNDEYAAILNKALIGLTATTSITSNGVQSVLREMCMERYNGFCEVLCDSINKAAPSVEQGPHYTPVWDKSARRRILLEMYVGVGCGDMAQRFCTWILERYRHIVGPPRHNDSLQNPQLRGEFLMCLDVLFCDWTRVLELYMDCNQSEKVPKWFVDEHRELFDCYMATIGVLQASGATKSMMDDYMRLANVDKLALNRLAIYDDAVIGSNKKVMIIPHTEASSSSSTNVQEQDEVAAIDVAASEAEMAEQQEQEQEKEKEKETMEEVWKESLTTTREDATEKSAEDRQEEGDVANGQFHDILSLATIAATTSATSAQAVRRLEPIMRAMGFSTKSNTCGV